MVNLIGNEIKKVFSKWGIKIILIIAVILMFVQAVVIKYYNEEIYYSNSVSYIDDNINWYEEELKNINPDTDIETYIDLHTQIDLCKLQKEYADDENWKLEFISSNAYEYLYAINNAKYGEKDTKALQKATEEYNVFLKVLENNDWRTYAKGILKNAKEELKNNKQALEISSNQNKKELEKAVAINEIKVETLEIRLNKNIAYDGSYMDMALNNYCDNMSFIIQSEDDEQAHRTTINYLKEEAMIAKYVLDTEKDLYNTENASSLYENYMTSIAELTVTLIIIIVAGSIVSEEFNKGTIKQLLIRPYGRVKIWVAKFLSAIIITIISMLILGIIASIVFGLFMGFDDYGVYNIGVYDYNTGSAYSMNVFAYVGIIFMSKLPLLIMLGTIAIFVSTILNNTALAVAVPLLGTIAATIVGILLENYKKFRFLKYFITPNWDWSVYNFGKPADLEFLSFKFSIAVYMVYFIVLIGLSILRFKKEDIKNI